MMLMRETYWLHAGICGPIPAGLSIDGIRSSAAELTQPRLLVDADPSDYELYLTSLTCPGARSMLVMPCMRTYGRARQMADVP